MTPKQQRFVEEYLVDLNATQAARRAGYSARSAATFGHRLLQRPEVMAAVRAAMQARSRKTAVTAERVLEELACIAFSDLRELAGWGPDGVRPRPSGELAEGAARALAEVAETSARGGSAVRIKLHDKKAALDALARHLGMHSERKSSVAARDLVRRLEAGRQRLATRNRDPSNHKAHRGTAARIQEKAPKSSSKQELPSVDDRATGDGGCRQK